IDLEQLNGCYVDGNGSCSAAGWTGTVLISEGQGSDSYQGMITVVWAGAVGTVSGVLMESEGAEVPVEVGPLTGTMTSPAMVDHCNGNFAVSGNYSTNV
ncbi:MAG TPA: hypothetical protein VG245_03775, partial [Candidatus Dormibacteraeota bacterium]|nr:hypothetical protein [Candidatus Dormibacteraeota bacterium]